MQGPDRSPVPSPSRSGAGWTSCAGPLLVAEMGQPPHRGDRVAVAAPRPRGPRGVPDRLAGRSVATDQGLSVPLDEVGLARSQRDGFGDERKRDGLGPQQAVVVEREVMSPRLAAVDRDPVCLTHEPRRLDAQAVIAGGQGEDGARADVERLADRLVARDSGSTWAASGGPSVVSTMRPSRQSL